MTMPVNPDMLYIEAFSSQKLMVTPQHTYTLIPSFLGLGQLPLPGPAPHPVPLPLEMEDEQGRSAQQLQLQLQWPGSYVVFPFF